MPIQVWPRLAGDSSTAALRSIPVAILSSNFNTTPLCLFCLFACLCLFVGHLPASAAPPASIAMPTLMAVWRMPAFARPLMRRGTYA